MKDGCNIEILEEEAGNQYGYNKVDWTEGSTLSKDLLEEIDMNEITSNKSRINKLKQKIHNGETVLGLAIPMTMGREELVQLLPVGPYDFVSVDSQHAAYNEERLVAFCEMAAGLDLPVQFRIKHTLHTYLVGNYLDLGPTGVEIPQVETEQTVAEAVSNFYYPPSGIRSWGGQTRLGLSEIPDRHQYAKWWGQAGILWIQIESVAAVTKARSLAKEGVDCLSFGPADLSFSLEAHPNHPFKTVDDCVRYVVEQLSDSSVAVCFRNFDPATRQKYQDMGVTVLLERPNN